MNKNILVACLLLLNFFLLYKIGSTNKTVNSNNIQHDNCLSQIKNQILQSYRTNDDKLPDNILLYDPETSANINFDMILENQNKLIMFYDKKDCELCLLQELEKTKMLSKKIGKENIIYIVFDKYKSYSKIFKRVNNLGSKVYSLDKILLEPNLHFMFTPVLMLVDSLRNVKNSCYPNKEVPRYSDLFYRYIEEEFEN